MLIPHSEIICVSELQELVSKGSDAVLEGKPTAWPLMKSGPQAMGKLKLIGLTLWL